MGKHRAPRSDASLLHLLTVLYITLRRFLNGLWIRFNRLLCENPPRVSRSPREHKVVLAGDGFAEGTGDWVVLGEAAGPAKHLPKFVEGTRQRWHLLNRGATGSTSSMWLPGKPLFEKTFSKAPCGDAEIVVFFAGTMDLIMGELGMPLPAMKKGPLDDYEESEMCNTLKNVRITCNELVRQGKRVVLTTIPTVGAGLGHRSGLAKRYNRQLMLFARSLPSESGVCVMRMSDPRLLRHEYRCYDGLHLNSLGYKMVSKILWEELKPLMLGVEFRVWKRMLDAERELECPKY